MDLQKQQDDAAIEALRIGWKHIDAQITADREAAGLELVGQLRAFTEATLALKAGFVAFRLRQAAKRGTTATFAEVKPWAR